MSGENSFGHRDPVEGEPIHFTEAELADAHGENDPIELPADADMEDDDALEEKTVEIEHPREDQEAA